MKRGLAILSTLALLSLLLASPAVRADAASQYFPETRHNVSGLFLQYWTDHGGLAQQGYPLTEEFQEKSDLNGQVYTVQYFERAVFEHHTENAGTAYEVLLSQLGKFRYTAKYGAAGAPSQQASADNPRKFDETGMTIGGAFRAYWEAQGGLAQQGFPISNEFDEKSDLNGQTYRVQYFERAVFELHPENQPPYTVLLSQLGKFEQDRRYPDGSNPAAAPAQPLTGAPEPTATTAPAAQPTNTPTAPAHAFCQPPAGAGYQACAVVSDPNPPQRGDVRVTGVLFKDGGPLPGAVMNSTWHYASKNTPCSGAKTDAQGVAGCTNGIGAATIGFEVKIDVWFTDDAGNILARAETSFTPK